MDKQQDADGRAIEASLAAPEVFTIGRAEVSPVPEHLRRLVAPATWTIYEWTEYQVSFTDTTHLRIGSQIVAPTFSTGDGRSHFRLRYENELGYTTLQPLADGIRSAPPLHIEVLARKFPSIDHSLDFMNGLLTDLFARGATLPFSVTRRTARTIQNEQRAPNDLFAFHFFRHHHEELIRAVQAVLGAPHRVLSDRVEHVRVHEVKRIDNEALLHMLRAPSKGAGSPQPPGASPLHRLQPERVLQRIPEETFDTPENRYILSIARRMFITMKRIRQASWFPYVQEGGIVTDIPQTFNRLEHHFRQLVTDRRFAGLEESVAVPSQSRVLQNKDGYRDLTWLWDVFHRHQQPVYEKMQRAIDLRDVPTLYEFWLLFELIDGIRAHTGIRPRMRGFDTIEHPGTAFTAVFPGVGTLTYQASFSGKDVYSGITLRPDYVWETASGRRIVMDAKFRISYPWPKDGEDMKSLEKSRATTDDVSKMHAYRDAIEGVTAALVLYPGANGYLKTPERTTQLVHRVDDLISDIISGDVDGIGAIPISPLRSPRTGGTQT